MNEIERSRLLIGVFVSVNTERSLCLMSDINYGDDSLQRNLITSYFLHMWTTTIVNIQT